MKLLRTPQFERNYAKASQKVQRAFDKQSFLLLQNLHHPSLRAKKYDESRGSGRHASTRIGASISSSRTMDI